jgi:membrane carboxypeptidase/penicillin-binding protein
MGYPGKKKPLGNDMTGGKGALPMFVEFNKTFLKDKEKEEFPKAPDMPEDMRELFRQRQRELAAERAELAANAEDEEEEGTLPAGSTEPKLEQVTMPPPPKADDGPANPQTKPETSTPKVEATPPPATRPREAEPAKKKGKKGEGEP